MKLKLQDLTTLVCLPLRSSIWCWWLSAHADLCAGPVRHASAGQWDTLHDGASRPLTSPWRRYICLNWRASTINTPHSDQDAKFHWNDATLAKNSVFLHSMLTLSASVCSCPGGYYLTSAFGAMSLIRNFQEEQAARALSSETRDTLHQWHRRRTTQRSAPSIDDFQVKTQSYWTLSLKLSFFTSVMLT